MIFITHFPSTNTRKHGFLPRLVKTLQPWCSSSTHETFKSLKRNWMHFVFSFNRSVKTGTKEWLLLLNIKLWWNLELRADFYLLLWDASKDVIHIEQGSFLMSLRSTYKNSCSHVGISTNDFNNSFNCRKLFCVSFRHHHHVHTSHTWEPEQEHHHRVV